MNDNDVGNGEVNGFVDIFYVGILPVKVTLEVAEEMISAKPFDGCRMVDMYEPYDKDFMLGMLNSTYANGLYNSVILPALVKLFPEGSGVYTREISTTKLIKVREQGTYFEKMVIFNWLWAYSEEVDDVMMQVILTDWLMCEDKVTPYGPAFSKVYH